MVSLTSQCLGSFPSFLQYISQELCMTEGDDQLAAPSKEHLEQEKQLLLAFKPVMQKFLHDHTELQVSALYALQVHCNASSFPKGTPSPTRFTFPSCINNRLLFISIFLLLLLIRYAAALLCQLLRHGDH